MSELDYLKSIGFTDSKANTGKREKLDIDMESLSNEVKHLLDNGFRIPGVKEEAEERELTGTNVDNLPYGFGAGCYREQYVDAVEKFQLIAEQTVYVESVNKYGKKSKKTTHSSIQSGKMSSEIKKYNKNKGCNHCGESTSREYTVDERKGKLCPKCNNRLEKKFNCILCVNSELIKRDDGEIVAFCRLRRALLKDGPNHVVNGNICMEYKLDVDAYNALSKDDKDLKYYQIDKKFK